MVSKKLNWLGCIPSVMLALIVSMILLILLLLLVVLSVVGL